MQTPYIPSGWDYNPSSWPQRIPLILVAVAGFVAAAYLALFQLQILHSVWDPFFEGGAQKVLTSSLSRTLPIPDAVLGALGYLLDIISGIIGNTRRYKTMPWIVILFGIAVGPLGLVSLFLVVAQPLIVHSWCSICLFTALMSVIMIGPAMDEVLASLQYLKRVKQNQQSVWKAFWGDSAITSSVQ